MPNKEAMPGERTFGVMAVRWGKNSSGAPKRCRGRTEIPQEEMASKRYYPELEAAGWDKKCWPAAPPPRDRQTPLRLKHSLVPWSQKEMSSRRVLPKGSPSARCALTTGLPEV